MFNSVHIENFRGIRTTSVEGLAQVNVFFGKNNCGKSSILESVFLLAGQSNPTLPFSLNAMRGYAGISEQNLSLDFYNLREDNRIRISGEGDEPRALEVSAFHSQKQDVSLQDLGDQGAQLGMPSYGLRMNFSLGEKNYTTNILITNEDGPTGRVKADKRYTESLHAEYLPSTSMQIPVAEKFAQVVAEKQEQKIIDIMRCIEPKILDMQLVGKDLLVDVGLSRRLPINVMGDGLRKLVAVVLSVYRCRDGILLVDEIDNGFHFSVMPQLWKAVFLSAAVNRTQVFVTTHNLDSLKGLVAMLRDEENGRFRPSLSAYKLIKDETDEVHAVRYGYEQMEYSIEQEIEVR